VFALRRERIHICVASLLPYKMTTLNVLPVRSGCHANLVLPSLVGYGILIMVEEESGWVRPNTSIRPVSSHHQNGLQRVVVEN
jgi:hypothetical protein